MSFSRCILLRDVYGGRKPLLHVPSAGARRGLASRVGWGDMAIGTAALLPPRLLGTFGSDV